MDVLFRGIKAVLCGRRALGHEFSNTYSQPANIHSVKAANDNEASCSLYAHRVGNVQRALAKKDRCNLAVNQVDGSSTSRLVENEPMGSCHRPVGMALVAGMCLSAPFNPVPLSRCPHRPSQWDLRSNTKSLSPLRMHLSTHGGRLP